MGENSQFTERELVRENRPRIRLEIFRHDRKERNPDDFKVRLTPEGRTGATEAGKTRNPRPEKAVAIGSPRERSQETAVRNMLANEAWVTPEMSLEDIVAGVAKRQKVGQKIISTELLDFLPAQEDPRFAKIAGPRYLVTKDLIRFIFEESDQLVKDLGDDKDYSYSRLAGNVAELVLKYIKMYSTVERVLNKTQNDKKDKEGGLKEMQRFIASHNSVMESLLLKVIEKMEGREAARQFVEDMPDKNGFAFDEGYSVVIDNDTDITVKYKDKEWLVPVRIIEEIIRDRDELSTELKKGK